MRLAKRGFSFFQRDPSGYPPLFATILFLTIASLTSAHAQTTGSTGVEPGKIEDRIKRPSTQPPRDQAPAVPYLPQLHLEPDSTGASFILAGVEIIGATVYPVDAFASAYEHLLAHEIKLTEVQKMVAAITKKYHDDGYFLTSVVAEPQDLDLGILQIAIIEGEITQVSFTGDPSERKELLERFAAKIKSGGPARLDRLERYMMLIDDLPGATIEGSLKPVDKDKGEFELVLAVKHDSADGYLSLDNRGTRSVGSYQTLLHGNLNRGWTNSERTGLTIFTIPRSPKELAYAELTHEQHFGTEGLKAWVSMAHSEVDVGGIYSESDLGSRSSRAVLGSSYPVIRSRNQNLSFFGKFDVSRQRQNQNDVRISDDRLRLVRIGADYSLNDDLDGQNSISLELSRGLNILGASDGAYSGQSRAPSQTGAHVEFTKLTAFASRRQKIGDAWALQVSASGQKSDERLLSGEQFYIGGTQFGRAFDSGEISGDDGAATSVEVQFGQFLSKPYLDSYQIYGFYDFGVVWETASNDFRGHTSLSSTGGGVRLGVTKSVFAGLEVAKPLTRIVANEGDKGPRVFFYLLVNK